MSENEQRVRAVVGHAKTVDEAIDQIAREGISPQFSVVFADAVQDQAHVARRVHERLGGQSWGMTSAGEISSRLPGIQTGTVVILSIAASPQAIGFGVGSAPIRPSGPEAAGEAATKAAFENLSFKPQFLFLGMMRKSPLEMVSAAPFTLLTAHDGRTFVEEDALRGVANVVGRGARVVGGTAGDVLSRFTEPATFANGRAAKDEITLAAIGTALKNGQGMANAFAPVPGKGAFITASEGRVVRAFNGRLAADVYMELVGAKSREELASKFKDHPMGVLDVTSGYWQVRSPAAVQPDGSVSFFSAVPVGIGMTLLQATAESRIASVRTAVRRAWLDAGRPRRVAAVVAFNCILCHLHADALGCSVPEIAAIQQAVAELTETKNAPVAGFSTFGETGSTITGTLGHHNQTLTVWLLSDELVHEKG